MKCVVCEERPRELSDGLCEPCTDDLRAFLTEAKSVRDTNPMKWAARRARELEREAAANRAEDYVKWAARNGEFESTVGFLISLKQAIKNATPKRARSNKGGG